MLSYTHRILAGQVPHRDFISPRPVGSSLLHLPDLLLPMPAYVAGRLVGIVTIVAYSILIAWIVYRRPPARWGVVLSAGAAASALVNLHTFVETQWYTFDGLLLSAAAFVMFDAALRRGDTRLRVAAFLVAGIAVTTKQSFVPAPVAMLVWLWWAERGRPRARGLLAAAVAAALPMLLYLAVIVVLGGGGDVFDQLTSGKLVWGRALFEIIGLRGPSYGRPPYTGHFPWEVALVVAVICLTRARRAHAGVGLALGALLVLLVGRLCFHQHLDRTGSWSLEVMWAFVLVLVIDAVATRRLPRERLLMLVLAWMAMLSWGYDVPALVGGSMALAVAVWAFEGIELGTLVARRAVPVVFAVAAIAAFVFSAVREVDARDRQPYFDQPASQLHYSVARFSPDFRGIKTSAPVASYLQGLRNCLRRYPAHWTAIVPDNAGLYDALGLHNPFPIDWFLRQDYLGEEGRIDAAANKLEGEGNYLVLLQTISGFFLNHFQGALLPANRGSSAVVLTPGLIYAESTGRSLVARLHGRHVVCGTFLGIWSPAHS